MNSTIITQGVSYTDVTKITQNPLIIIIILGIIWFLPLVLYLIIAGCTRIRTSSGVKLKGSMLSKFTGWIYPIIWLLQGGLIFILLIFPVWAGKTI